MNPQFVNAAFNQFELRHGSPCIDTGDPAAAPNSATDLYGEPRISDGTIDMGADETCLIGTTDGLTLQTFINGAPTPPTCDNDAFSGDALTLVLDSVGGLYDGSTFFFIIQPYVTTNPPVVPPVEPPPQAQHMSFAVKSSSSFVLLQWFGLVV